MRTMRKITVAAGMLAALALAGCASPSVTTTPDDVGTGVTVTTDVQPTTPRSAPASLGQTITIKGGMDTNALTLAVTLLKVAPTAHPVTPDIDGPHAGNRWMAAQFRIVNRGTDAYNDSPSTGAVVGDSEGQRYGAYFGDTTAGVSMPSSVVLAPGDTVKGWITFAVPKAASITLVQFGANSGYVNVAQWDVK